MTPAVTAIWAALMFNESLPPSVLIGGAVTLVGVATVELTLRTNGTPQQEADAAAAPPPKPGDQNVRVVIHST